MSTALIFNMVADMYDALTVWHNFQIISIKNKPGEKICIM